MKQLQTIVKEIWSEQERGRKSGLQIARLVTEANENWESYKTLPMVADKTFQQFLGEQFGYSKGTISKMISITNRFLSEVDPREDWTLWNASQLMELISVDDGIITTTLESGELSRDMTVAEIRKLFATMKQLETSEDSETSENSETSEDSETSENSETSDSLTNQQIALKMVLGLHEAFISGEETTQQLEVRLDALYNQIMNFWK